MDDLVYSRLGDAIIATTDVLYPESDRVANTIGFKAEEVARERTGIHARISICLVRGEVWRPLAWSRLNIEKGEERRWLANQAYRMLKPGLNGASASYPDSYLQDDLGQFTLGLWAFHVEADAAEEMDGDPDPPPPTFLLEPFVLKGGGTIHFAPPGRGKSYIVMLMAVSIDAGVSTIWRVPGQSKVLLINLERSRDSVRARLGNINRVLGLSPSRRLLTMNARGRSLRDILPAARKAVERYGVQVVVLDSISRAGYGDLNENAPVNQIVDALNNLAPTWLAIGHTPRGDATHVFGSQHFDAGADLLVSQISQQEDETSPLGVGLAIVKGNDVPNRRTPTIALEFNATGLKSWRLARPGEFPDVDRGRPVSLKLEIIDYILDQADARATATQIAKEMGRNRTNISTLLSNDPDFIVVHKEGREKYYGVAVQKNRLPSSDPGGDPAGQGNTSDFPF